MATERRIQRISASSTQLSHSGFFAEFILSQAEGLRMTNSLSTTESVNPVYRFRLHRKNLPGKPDLVFPSRRKVIFIHGCFWHQHPECREGRVPGSRREY